MSRVYTQCPSCQKTTWHDIVDKKIAGRHVKVFVCERCGHDHPERNDAKVPNVIGGRR